MESWRAGGEIFASGVEVELWKARFTDRFDGQEEFGEEKGTKWKGIYVTAWINFFFVVSKGGAGGGVW